MPYIKVNQSKLSLFKGTFDTVSSKVSNIQIELKNTSKAIDYDIKCINNINRTLSNIIDDLSIEHSSLKKMSNYLVSANSLYFKHGGLDELNIPNKTEEKSNKCIDNLLTITKKMGIVGSTVGGIGSIVSKINKVKTSGKNLKTVTDVLNEGVKIGKGINKFIDAYGVYSRTTNKVKIGKPKFKDKIFGLNDVFNKKYSKASSAGVRWKNNFTKAFKKNLDDFKIGSKAKSKIKVNSKSVKASSKIGKNSIGKAKTKTNVKSSKVGKGATKTAGKILTWVGAGLTLAGNAYENYNEYKDSNGKVSAIRAIGETALETVTDIGTGWIIGAAVAATSVALIGSAPVLLVGAVSAGITIGIDALCNWAFKKDLSECVSDLVCNGCELVVKGAKKIGSLAVKGAAIVKETGKNIAKKATKVVSNAVKAVTSKAKEVVSVGKAVSKTAKKVVSNTVKTVAKTAKKATQSVKKVASNVGKTVTKGIKKVTSGIKKIFKW